jgi:DNA excision repair protein ERCC-2
MAPRFDPHHLTLELAVADLIEAELLRGVGFANRGGYERMWLGQAIHSHYQEEALSGDPSYRREVVLRHSFLHRGVTVTIYGRMDGLRRDPNGALVVEEIKSVRRGGQLSPTVREVYERQAALYAWLLGLTERVTEPPAEGQSSAPLSEIRAELVLIEIGSDSIDRHEVSVQPTIIEAGVRRRLNALLHTFEGERTASLERRAAAERLTFPYGGIRAGQSLIVDAASQALADRQHLLVEAPTGIGKTVAALFPALRYALAHDKRVFVLTARTLQQEMATTVLDLLNSEGKFHSLRLRSKAKMCANDEVLCHEEYCPYAKEFYLKLRNSGVVEHLWTEHSTLLPDTIFGAAKGAEVCPFEISLELGRKSQVVICDYNYAFAPFIALTDFDADADLSDTILVIDEIHNLVGRGREYLSPELSSARVLAVARELGEQREAIHRRLETLCLELARVLRDCVVETLGEPGATSRASEAVFPEEALWLLRPRFDSAFVDYLEHRRETRTLAANDPFVGLYFDLLRFLNGLVASDEAFSHCVELVPDRNGFVDGEDHRWKILCKDPSRFLGGVINRTHATIGLSATLSPIEFYRDLIGFDRERTGHLSVPSPFPAENRRVVIDATVATAYRDRAANYDRIAARMASFVQAVPGNSLVLFPSYQFLANVADRMPPMSKRVLTEQREGSDAARESVLSILRSSLFGDVVLLAVAGGVFAEGVDYPGEMLRAVAVVGPCLPALTLEQRLLQAYYDERFARGFEYAFVVPGMTRVVQAAGRLIRSPDDVGVIALFDQRFLATPYRHHLPVAWVGDNGAAALAGHPHEVAEEFFSQLDKLRSRVVESWE